MLSDQKKVLLFRNRKVSEITNLSSIHENVPLGPNWEGTCSGFKRATGLLPGPGSEEHFSQLL